MSASDAAPLPRLGEVFFDVRGSSRSMWLSWYANTGIAVFSIWQGGTCTGTFRLPMDDLTRLVDSLRRGVAGADGDPASGQRSRPAIGAAPAEPFTGMFNALADEQATGQGEPAGRAPRPYSTGPQPVYARQQPAGQPLGDNQAHRSQDLPGAPAGLAYQATASAGGAPEQSHGDPTGSQPAARYGDQPAYPSSRPQPYEQPSYGQPSYEPQSSYEQPSYESRSSYEQPSYGPQSYEQRVQPAPPREETGFDQAYARPDYGQQEYQQEYQQQPPVYDDHNYDGEGYDDQGYAAPGRAEQVPAGTEFPAGAFGNRGHTMPGQQEAARASATGDANRYAAAYSDQQSYAQSPGYPAQAPPDPPRYQSAPPAEAVAVNGAGGTGVPGYATAPAAARGDFPLGAPTNYGYDQSAYPAEGREAAYPATPSFTPNGAAGGAARPAQPGGQGNTPATGHGGASGEENAYRSAARYPNGAAAGYAEPNGNGPASPSGGYARPNGSAYPAADGGGYPTSNGSGYRAADGNGYPTSNENGYPTPNGSGYPASNENGHPAANGSGYLTSNASRYTPPDSGGYPVPDGNGYAPASGGYAQPNGSGGYPVPDGSAQANGYQNGGFVPGRPTGQVTPDYQPAAGYAPAVQPDQTQQPYWEQARQPDGSWT